MPARRRFRSAITGRFVRATTALRAPWRTVGEAVRRPLPGPLIRGDDGHVYAPARFHDDAGIPVQGFRRVSPEEVATHVEDARARARRGGY